MTKPRLEHIAAVTRTQHLLETAVNVDDNPSLAKRIGRDIQLLCQVREILYHYIENPTLPFTGEPLVDKIEDAPDEAD